MGLYRGEGGVVWDIAEPLSGVHQDQLRKHLLVPVESEDAPQVAVQEPAQTAAKVEWVDFAVGHGMSRKDAEAATKAELIEKYGS